MLRHIAAVFFDLADYEFVKDLSCGGQGSISLYRHKVTGEMVTIKTFFRVRQNGNAKTLDLKFAT